MVEFWGSTDNKIITNKKNHYQSNRCRKGLFQFIIKGRQGNNSRQEP